MLDSQPSKYLEKIGETEHFNQYPFDLLKRMKKTKQSPKYHPEEDLAREFLQVFTEDTAFVEAVCGLVRYHMQILFVTKGTAHTQLKEMKRSVDIYAASRKQTLRKGSPTENRMAVK